MAARDLSPLAWLAIGVGALALLGGGAVVTTRIVRSIRNNNPGNIEKGAKWRGLHPTQTDPRFAVFTAPEWGFRAMARILLGDFRKGRNTVRALISKWAPPTENKTEAYIAAVARELRVAPDAPFDVPARLRDLLRAIARHETGRIPPEWSDAVIDRGIALERQA